MEKFIVKHYSEDKRPTIKGNGFDGLEIGEYRDNAEEFVKFINKIIEGNSQKLVEIKKSSTNNKNNLIPLDVVEKLIVDWVGENAKKQISELLREYLEQHPIS